jgi:hypothetical protein
MFGRCEEESINEMDRKELRLEATLARAVMILLIP